MGMFSNAISWFKGMIGFGDSKGIVKPNPNFKNPDNRVLISCINHFKMPNSDLAGCCNDGDNWYDFLVNTLQFNPACFKIIKDEAATTKNIKDGILWLSQTPKNAVAIYIHSGHGALSEDNAEILCPQDFDWSEEHMIRGSYVHETLSTTDESVSLWIFIDACHSENFQERGITKGIKKAFPHVPVGTRIRYKTRDMSKTKSLVHGALRCGSACGCLKNQTSADAFIDGKPCGAFFTFLLKELRTDFYRTGKSLEPIIQNKIHKAGFEQTPNINGPLANTILFS